MLFVRVLPQFGLAFFDNIIFNSWDNFNFDKMLTCERILKVLGSSFIYSNIYEYLLYQKPFKETGYRGDQTEGTQCWDLAG